MSNTIAGGLRLSLSTANELSKIRKGEAPPSRYNRRAGRPDFTIPKKLLPSSRSSITGTATGLDRPAKARDPGQARRDRRICRDRINLRIMAAPLGIGRDRAS